MVEETHICSLFTLSRDWNVDEVTWNKADASTEWANIDPDTKVENKPEGTKGGGDWNAGAIATAKCAEADNWEVYDITDALKNILKNPDTYFGFAAKPYWDNTGRTYKSSEDSEQAKRPKLTVRYDDTDEIINIVSFNGINKNILIDKSSQNLKVYIPFEDAYSVSISNVKGRTIYSFQGNSKTWHQVPKGTLAPGMHIIGIRTAGTSVFSKFLFVD